MEECRSMIRYERYDTFFGERDEHYARSTCNPPRRKINAFLDAEATLGDTGALCHASHNFVRLTFRITSRRRTRTCEQLSQRHGYGSLWPMPPDRHGQNITGGSQTIISNYWVLRHLDDSRRGWEPKHACFAYCLNTFEFLFDPSSTTYYCIVAWRFAVWGLPALTAYLQ